MTKFVECLPVFVTKHVSFMESYNETDKLLECYDRFIARFRTAHVSRKLDVRSPWRIECWIIVDTFTFTLLRVSEGSIELSGVNCMCFLSSICFTEKTKTRAVRLRLFVGERLCLAKTTGRSRCVPMLHLYERETKIQAVFVREDALYV